MTSRRDRVVVVPGAAFRVAQDEADDLCATLNRHFEGRLALRVQSPQKVLLVRARLFQYISADVGPLICSSPISPGPHSWPSSPTMRSS